jgi:hypothetical protein
LIHWMRQFKLACPALLRWLAWSRSDEWWMEVAKFGGKFIEVKCGVLDLLLGFWWL